MKKCLAHIPSEAIIGDPSGWQPAWINAELPLDCPEFVMRNAIHHDPLFKHVRFKDCFIYIYDSKGIYMGYYRNGVYKARREEW